MRTHRHNSVCVYASIYKKENLGCFNPYTKLCTMFSKQIVIMIKIISYICYPKTLFYIFQS